MNNILAQHKPKIETGEPPIAENDGMKVYLGSDSSQNRNSRSVDFGENFNRMDALPTGFRYNASATSQDGAYLLMCGSGNPAQLSTNGGDSFTPKGGSESYTQNSACMSADGQYMYYCPYNRRIERSANFGNSFSNILATGSRQWRGISCSDDGQHVCAAGSTFQIYVSNDFGVTWNARGLSKYRVDCAVSGNGKYMYACRWVNSGDDPGIIEVSSDYGATWQEIKPTGGLYCRSVDVSGTGKYVVLASTQFVWVSNDYGKTFVRNTLNLIDTYGVYISWHGKYIYAHATTFFYSSNDFGQTFIARNANYPWTMCVSRLKE